MKSLKLPFRPFKYIKRFLPKTLFARSLLIIVTPLILVQGITTYVFVERHWSWVTKHIAQTISSQIVTVVDMIEQNNELLDLTQGRFALDVNIERNPSRKLSTSQTYKKKYTWDEAYFDSILSRVLKHPFKVRMDTNFTRVDVEVNNKIVHLVTARKRLFAKTTPIFLIWSLGTPIIFFLIAALFMRNQVRPIRRLAYAASLFGKRRLMDDFKPEGAFEVRKAGIAFNQMRERIERQITQRTEMLAGVSHDLKTPLTRMKLQLAMMEESKEIKGLRADIKEMSKTIEEYIEFARGEEKENLKHINLPGLVRNIARKIKTSQIKFYFDFPKNLKMLARQHSLQRCLTNILVNAKKYAKNIWITGYEEQGDIYLIIDDDGPGIPVDKRAEVFKPFYRVESSRNRKTGGSGLGLAIAYDIIVSHGGIVKLATSSKGGLRVKIHFPE